MRDALLGTDDADAARSLLHNIAIEAVKRQAGYVPQRTDVKFEDSDVSAVPIPKKRQLNTENKERFYWYAMKYLRARAFEHAYTFICNYYSLV